MEDNPQEKQEVEQKPETEETTAANPLTVKPEQKSNKKKIAFLLSAIVVIVLAAVLYKTVLNKKPEQVNTNTSGQNGPVAKPTSRFYVGVNDIEANTDQVLVVDPTDQSQKTLYTNKNISENNNYSSTSVIAVKNVNGVHRKFLNKNNTVNGKTTSILAYQDDDNEQKVMYSVNSDNSSNGYVFIYPPYDSISPAMDSIGFYEFSLDKTELKMVDIKGNVTVLASRGDGDKAWISGFDRTLTPGAMSADGKTMYLHAHSCLQCDGPPLADLVALDIPTKKFTKLFSKPDDLTGGWSKVNDDTVWISASNFPGLGGPGSYEEVIKYRSRLYTFDLKTNSSKRIFENTEDAYRAKILGWSSDGNKVFVNIENIVKDNKMLDEGYGSTGHEWHYVHKELRVYDARTGNYELLSLPVDLTGQELLFLNSKDDTYIYGLSTRYRPFDQSTDRKVSNELYVFKQGGQNAVKLYGDNKSYINFMGFE